MEIHPIELNGYTIKNNLLLAPLAGYTDYVFRKITLPLGVGLCFTELTSAKGLYYGGKNSEQLLYCGDEIENTGAQIFGSETYFMRWACESDYLKPFKIVDINMGCPVPKVYKNGEGSALLKDILRAENIVKECVKSGKIITVKIRTGLKKGDDIASEFCKMAENAGASMVTIHGRTREEFYTGDINIDAIKKAKQSVKIPIIANGGIFTEEDADRVINETGADGVMIARGALSDPFIFSKLLGEKPYTNRKNFILSHLRLSKERYGDKKSAVEFRKFVPYYFKGIDDIKELKNLIVASNSADEIIELIDKNF